MPKEPTSDTEVEGGGEGQISALANYIETRLRYWIAKETRVRLHTVNIVLKALGTLCSKKVIALAMSRTDGSRQIFETYVHRFQQ